MGLERAAVQRGKELDVLATVYDAIGAMRDTLQQVTHVLEVATGKIESLHAENAELRDGMLALSNRIESLTQACNTNLEKQLDTLSDHVGRIRTLEQASL